MSSSDDGALRIWDIGTGSRHFFALAGHGDRVHHAAISPDGRTLLSSSSDKTARLWDMETGREIVTLRGHDQAVFMGSFSPDGSEVVTAGRDQKARIWPVDVVEAALAAGPRELTFEEKEAYDILSADERNAKALVDRLLDELVFGGFVKERLENESGISDTIRELAIKVADKRSQKITAFVVNEAWAVVKSPGAATGELQLALRKAKAAYESEPNGYFMMVLGVAHYRLKHYDDAKKALLMALRWGMDSDIVCLSFAAMTHQRLGEGELARANLGRAKVLMRDPKRAPSEEYKAILREATGVVDGSG